MGGGAPSKDVEQRADRLQQEVTTLKQKQEELEKSKRDLEKSLENEQKKLQEEKKRNEELQKDAKDGVEEPGGPHEDDEKDAEVTHSGVVDGLKALEDENAELQEKVLAAQKEKEELKALLPTSELPEDTKLKELKDLEKESKELAALLDELEGKKSSAQVEREHLEIELQELTKEKPEEEVTPEQPGVEEPKAADGEEVISGDPPPEAGSEKEKEHEEKEVVAATPVTPTPAEPERTGDVAEPAEAEPSPAEPADGDLGDPVVEDEQKIQNLREKITEVETRERQLYEEVQSTEQRRAAIGATLAEYAEDAPGRVREATQRGVGLGSLLDFFVDNCGEVSFEASSYRNEDDWRKPLCTATKLSRVCHQANQENRFDIARKRIRPLSPNVFAVEKLFIRPMTEEKRCSAAEVWNEGEPLAAEHFVSHSWTEDFGNLVQGLTRFAVSLTFRESPALPQDKAAGHARGCSFFIHAFSNSMWSENRDKNLEDLAVYQVLSSKSIKTVLFSTGQDGTALLRAWCSLELFLAKGFGQNVVLNTKLGPMQDQSGPSALTPHIQQFATMLLKVVLPEIDVARAPCTKDAEKSILLKYFDDNGGQLQMKKLKNVISEVVCSQCLAIMVQNASVDLVKTALELGAEADSMDGLGIHPLTYAVAAEGEKSEVAELLLSFGGCPEAALGAKHVLELFSTDDELRRKGVLELGKCGEPARKVHGAAIETAKREYARRLVDMRWDELQSSDDEVRLSVLAAIEKIGPLAAPLGHDIAPLLADANIKIVEAVSKVVVNFGAIEDYLADPNPLTRSGVLKHVVRARGREACADFAQHFVNALFDEDFRVRHAGSQALLELGDLAAPFVEDLAKALKDDDWYVRINAVQALGKVGLAATPYISDVATCLGDKMPEVRRQAKEVLTKLRALHAERE